MKKIDLGEVAQQPKETGAPKKMVTPDAETGALLSQWVSVAPQYKTLKNQTETLSKQIAVGAKRLFFTTWQGTIPLGSTMLVEVDEPTDKPGVTIKRTVKLVTKETYSKKLTDWALLEAAIGKEIAEKNFRWSTMLEFDLDTLPEKDQDTCAQALIALAKEKGWLGAIKSTQYVAPRAGFHQARTTLLTPEQNVKLDQVLPITAFPQL